MALIVEYADVLQLHGVGSKQARGFLEAHKDDTTFLRRAGVLNRCFLNRDLIVGEKGTGAPAVREPAPKAPTEPL